MKVNGTVVFLHSDKCVIGSRLTVLRLSELMIKSPLTTLSNP
jgi:hypothetical protein